MADQVKVRLPWASSPSTAPRGASEVGGSSVCSSSGTSARVSGSPPMPRRCGQWPQSQPRHSMRSQGKVSEEYSGYVLSLARMAGVRTSGWSESRANRSRAPLWNAPST